MAGSTPAWVASCRVRLVWQAEVALPDACVTAKAAETETMAMRQMMARMGTSSRWWE